MKGAQIWMYWRDEGCPVLHSSIDNEEWKSKNMEYQDSHPFCFKINVVFNSNLKFVICNEAKTHWYNPHKELSESYSFIKDGDNTNFFIEQSGGYVIINSVLSRLTTVKSNKEKQLVVINVDGVLVGDDLSLVYSNIFWMANYYFSLKTLVYITGRSLAEVMKLDNIILPQYLVCEGGSKIFKLKLNHQNSEIYQIISSNLLTPNQQELLKQLQTIGFYRANQSRLNSYVVPKGILVKQNNKICKMLSTIQNNNIEYNIVEETEVVYFDFTVKGVNKLEAIKEIEGIEDTKVSVTFGSNLSDYPLMQYSKRCVVPVNGTERLKELLQHSGFKSRGQFAEAIIQYFQQYS